MSLQNLRLPKGICYGNDVFPKPYDPSTANTIRLFFGSDPASAPFGALWDERFTSSMGSTCYSPGPSCREDLFRIKNMGVQVIRLYDWEPRNDHMKFLDRCVAPPFNLRVLVSVSNYFLQPGPKGGYDRRTTHIPNLIRSFSKGADYHPAIVGVVFGNELEGYDETQLAGFTKDWLAIESTQFKQFRALPFGHPIQFSLFGGKYPCFNFWDRLSNAGTWWGAAKKQNRLFLAPQTYNDAGYLFKDAEGSKRGWVDLAWERYGAPIWFTEMGYSRVEKKGKPRPESEYTTWVKGQLQGTLAYNKSFPDRLIGACFFSFADKSWKVPDQDPEGSFGAHRHGATACRIQYGQNDFPHREGNPDFTLGVDKLEPSPLYDAVRSGYLGQP